MTTFKQPTAPTCVCHQFPVHQGVACLEASDLQSIVPLKLLVIFRMGELRAMKIATTLVDKYVLHATVDGAMTPVAGNCVVTKGTGGGKDPW